MSDFDKALQQILKLTQAAFDEYSALKPDSAEQFICRGKLLAYNCVLEVFSRIDVKKLAASAN